MTKTSTRLARRLGAGASVSVLALAGAIGVGLTGSAAAFDVQCTGNQGGTEGTLTCASTATGQLDWNDEVHLDRRVR